MPNISKAEWDEKVAETETYKMEADRLRAERDHLEWEKQQFDDTLMSIIQAGHGAPIQRRRSEDARRLSGVNFDTDASFSPGMMLEPQRIKLTKQMQWDRERDQLNQRIVYLETRLSASLAIAQFARHG